MRALLVSPCSTPGGAERSLAALAQRLPSYGVEVSTVVLQGGDLEDWLTEAGCRFDVIQARRTRYLHRTATTVARLARRARSADVVVSNQSKGQVYGGLAARVAGRPSIWWQRAIPSRSPIEWAAGTVGANMVVCSSEAAAVAQRQLHPRLPTAVIHPGTDIARVRSRRGDGAQLRTWLGVGMGPLVGNIGRLQEGKGQEVFLRAAARVAAHRPDTTFVVVGGAVLGWEGDYPQRLEALAAELGVADRTRFVGHQADVHPWFDACDVVVHASWGESFGQVLTEAMALGRPLVATAAGGPTEIIEDEISGLLVPPGDDGAMAASIVRVIEDRELRVRLSAGAWVRAERFDADVTARTFAELLTDRAF
jgi:glycosyltransferase involved in cell wall biosynthesis